MANSNGISLVVVLLSLMSGIGFGQDSGESVSICFERVKEILPENWEVVQTDEKPSVSVGGWDGYRFLLMRGWKDYLNLPQQQRDLTADPNAYDDYEYVMKYSHIDLVLFPASTQLGDDFLRKMAWMELEGQAYFVKPVYMGTGDGFHWFINASLYWQEYIREKMALTGGDDRIQILIEGLSIDDRGSNTRNSVVGLLANHGDAVIPHLQEIIKENDSDKSRTAFRVLAYIRTDQSTQLLKAYYASKKTRELAAYALIHHPYQPEAKDEYIDMLKRRIRIFDALGACVEYNWTEALPNIEKICAEPKQWHIFYKTYLAKRTLQGDPVPADILNAHQTILGHSGPEDIERAKVVILQSTDKESAAVIAIDLLAGFRFKINHDRLELIVAAGRDMLEALPEETTTPLISHLLDSLDEESSRTVEKLKAFYEKE
ncbi:MAG: hypothetical protein ABFR90_07010 [Planctomycetota bacterium]